MNSPIIGGKLGYSLGSDGELTSQKFASATLDMATSESATAFAEYIIKIYLQIK